MKVFLTLYLTIKFTPFKLQDLISYSDYSFGKKKFDEQNTW